jgi:hypothetical protein
VPEKLDRCVADVKAKGDVDNPYAVCNASIGKETKEHHNPLDIPFGYEVNEKVKEDRILDESNDTSRINHNSVKEQIIQEKVNANRQVPVFNPPIIVGKIEPQINKTTKGIGGLEGKIGEPVKNPKPSDLWKDILDSQLKRNVKEPNI